MKKFKSDIEIARSCKLKPISKILKKINVPDNPKAFSPMGRHIAKINFEFLDKLKNKKDGHLILVTAITPTPAGEGKTTTSVGLNDGLNKIGKKSIVCLREPSLGPSFGMKGGAAGGGNAQVVPMEQINLHFTGDFHAITSAHNLLSALIDNHIYWGNKLNIDEKKIVWKRVVDMNDRALRFIDINTKGVAKDFAREDGFDITVASEVMAIFCLSNDLSDLEKRIGNITIAYDKNNKPVYAKDLNAQGPMTVLLKEAIRPNVTQSLEHNPAIIHGGPFANIAHGCNSVIATKSALKLSKYVVTEAGFGADLGAEKFLDIKCRKANIKPRIANRFEEQGSELEQPLAIARDINQLYFRATNFKQSLPVSRFLVDNNDLRHVVRRAFLIEKFPYSEIQDNTIGHKLIPIDMLRLKLSFFGACKFDPRSDKWLRICMFQGAPLPEELNNFKDNWIYNSLN